MSAQSRDAENASAAPVAGRPCIVCGATHWVGPAHLIPRRWVAGAIDAASYCSAAAASAPVTAAELDLLAHLEPAWRAQLAHAVGHVGLIGALRRISAGPRTR